MPNWQLTDQAVLISLAQLTLIILTVTCLLSSSLLRPTLVRCKGQRSER